MSWFEWAVRTLQLGLDMPSLRMLASFDTSVSWFEAHPVLQTTLQELGVQPIGEDEARRHRLV